jgi:hypothetical protein
MTTTPTDERQKIVLHNHKLAKSQSDLFALSQLCLGLATSPVQERLTYADRQRIASFVHDQIDNSRVQNSFDLQAALQG